MRSPTRSSTLARGSAALATALAVVLLAPGRADACSDEPETGLGTLVTLPADGGTAPDDSHVFIAELAARAPETSPTWRLRVGGVLVTASERRIDIAGEWPATLVELAPAGLLPPGATVEIIADHGGAEEVRARFTVAGADTWTATTPTLYSLGVTGAYFGLYSCPEPSRVGVTVTGPHRLFLVREVGQADDTALTVGTSVATAVDLDAGEHQLELVGLDALGQRSPASAPFAVTIPAEVTGCDAGGAGERHACWLVALAALTLTRRRRR